MSRKTDIDELLVEVGLIKSEVEKLYDEAKSNAEITQIPKTKVKSALEHLRSVLDYCALDIHDKFYDGKGKIYFPYGKNEALFKKHLKGHFKNFSSKAPKVYEIIKTVQSFETDKDWLITLCTAVNSNKHNRLSNQTQQSEKSATLGNIAKASGGGKIIFHGGTVNGIPIAKDEGVPVVISGESSEEEMRESLNPDNPFLVLRKETEKIEFVLDETSWDALELISQASSGVEKMVQDLYEEITSNN